MADALIPLVTLAVLIGGTNLSRLAADSGALTSPLVPWNSCGAFLGATLGVSTLVYLPYAAFFYASPFLSVLYGFTGIRIEKTEPSETAKELT